MRSALDQTLPKDLYEVIVIKNFRDEAIDRQLEKWGVVDLYSDDVSQGGKVRDALPAGTGGDYDRNERLAHECTGVGEFKRFTMGARCLTAH